MTVPVTTIEPPHGCRVRGMTQYSFANLCVPLIAQPVVKELCGMYGELRSSPRSTRTWRGNQPHNLLAMEEI
jgi:hypothetical protein